MKALLTDKPGGWEATHWTDVPEPIAGPGEVVVEIKAAGLNPADNYQVLGRYPGAPAPPFVTGRDAAGIVVEGDGPWTPGSAVVILQSGQRSLAAGAFCERQRFPADHLAPLPAGWTMEEGAAAPLVYLTAWRALVEHGKLQPGQHVAITGASGGVGTAVTQLAIGMGAVVVALSRSESKRQRLLKLGARYAFSSDDPDLKKKVFEAIGKKGVDIVVDTVGGPLLADSVHLLGKKGKAMVLGVLGGADGAIPIPSLMFKEATVQGIVVTEFTAAAASAAWKRIVDVLASKSMRPIVDACIPFADFARAFARLQESPFGKVVLKAV